jgi:phosphoglycolate phosphatase-like HAD superfamily hydrolase
MKHPVTHYKTLVFDCDGVVLNSNKVKTEAFYLSTLPYGESSAQAMVNHHVVNGGVSRYKKFAYFLEKIAPQFIVSPSSDLEQLLHAYASHVREGLLRCEVASGLEILRQRTSSSRWLIVSGGDQDELCEVFAQREIAEWFDGGIFGSPDSKEVILARELASANIQQPALFLGDSKYDHRSSTEAGIDFIFLSGWSEVVDWQTWVAKNRIAHISRVQDLIGVCS